MLIAHLRWLHDLPSATKGGECDGQIKSLWFCYLYIVVSWYFEISSTNIWKTNVDKWISTLKSYRDKILIHDDMNKLHL